MVGDAAKVGIAKMKNQNLEVDPLVDLGCRIMCVRGLCGHSYGQR